MRTPLMAGNWKLNLTIDEAVGLATALAGQTAGLTDREVMIAPVFTALAPVGKALEGRGIYLGAQDVYWESSGAWTGEVSAPLLKDAGCSHVIVGHSERRQHFGETDEDVNRKARAAIKAGLLPVICVGETLEEREAGRERDVVHRMVKSALEGVSPEDASSVILAYEPVWAIGTGKTASPDQADEIHGYIRGLLSGSFGDIVADRIRILYGGSVKPDNVDELMGKPHIDGALVGGASLEVDSFSRIVRFEKG